ncbi:MAG: AEC family transporter [Planctomycetia bacterium]|nr:AEC family transporter [Planctomycetia bacterium]
MDNPVFQASLAVFLIMLVGCVLRHFRWLAPEADRTLLNLSVNFLYPCLIFSKIFRTDLSAHFSSLWLFPVCGFTVIIIGIFFSWIFTIFPAVVTGLHNKAQRRTFIACVSMINYGFLPIPLIMQLYPENDELLTLLFVFNLGLEFALWTCVVPLMAGGLERGWWKKLFRIPLLAILFAVTANFLGFSHYISGGMMTALDMLGMSQIPLALIMIGAIIYDELAGNFRSVRRRDTVKIIIGTLLVRAAILPLCMILLACCLPDYPWLQKIIVIQAAMPCATTPIMFARMYEGASDVAVRTVLVSSVASLVTVVFWVSWGMWMIGSPLLA